MNKFASNFLFCIKLLYNKNKKSFFILISINLITLIGTYVELFLIRHLINSISSVLTYSSNVEKINIFKFLILYYTILGLTNFFTNYCEKISALNTQQLLIYINNELMKKSVDIDISYFDIPTKYDEMQRSKENAHSMHNIVFSTMLLLRSIISIIISIFLCCNINVFLVLITFVSSFAFFIYKSKYERLVYEFNKKLFREVKVTSFLYNILFHRVAAKDIRFYQSGGFFRNRFLKSNEELVNQQINFSKKLRLKSFILNLPSEFFQVVIQIYVVIQILNKKLLIGDYNYITGLFKNLQININEISDGISLFIGYSEKISDFKNYFLLANTEIESGNIDIEDIVSIEFKNIYFKYPNNKEYILNNVSFKIEKNEKVMIVGLNGAGKSTILKLLMRFYEPSQGTIWINNINIKKINLKNLRKKFSIVFQEFNIYPFTIRENVALGQLDKNSNEESIIKALKFAELYKEEYATKYKIDNYLTKEFTDDGIILSGGESQRIAIARAVFREFSGIILDEPTAALDPEAEYKILELFRKLYKDKILIMVSHKLSNVKEMDKIIFIDKGKIYDIGCHEVLMKNNKNYSSLYELQQNKYIIDN